MSTHSDGHRITDVEILATARVRDHIAVQLLVSPTELDDYPYDIEEKVGSNRIVTNWIIWWADRAPAGVPVEDAQGALWTSVKPSYLH